MFPGWDLEHLPVKSPLELDFMACFSASEHWCLCLADMPAWPRVWHRFPYPSCSGGLGQPYNPVVPSNVWHFSGGWMGGWKGLHAAGWLLAHPLAGSTNHGMKAVNKTYLGQFQRVHPCEPHVPALGCCRAPRRARPSAQGLAATLTGMQQKPEFLVDLLNCIKAQCELC